MSLNWKEIDLALSELDLEGARIERVNQPSFDSISLGLYKDGASVDLYVSIAQGACRIHSLSSPPPKPTRPLRFMECLRSRIVGGKILSIAQIGEERVVRIEIEAPAASALAGRDTVYKPMGQRARKVAVRKPDEPPSGYTLYARLWSGAGNVVLADDLGIVVDALARRPKRGEVSGEACSIEEDLAAAAGSGRTREFAIRDLPGEGSFNRRVELFYQESAGALSRDKLLEGARERYGKKERSLETRIAELSAREAEFKESERYRELGDIVMANQGRAYEGKYLPCEDFFRGGEVRIPVDPGLSHVQNARSYYERHKKARSGLEDVEAELAGARASLAKLKAELARLEAEEDPFLIARALAKGGTARPEGESKKRSYPGLSLEVSGWTILIGRSAKENDELLRHFVKGADLWLHARDWPGSYVFVKCQKGKTVPLEVLLDAGQLGIYYSKGRAKGGGDLYYTCVKNLRRAKDGPLGLVLPTHEKNLSARIDEARIKELRSLIGDDQD